jgi:hypothetical protein
MSKMVCSRPCKECPFRRASAPGYLGASSGDPWDFLESTGHGELHLPCHMLVDWTAPDAQEQAQHKPVCAGYAIMLKNESKIPRDIELAAPIVSIKPDKKTIFANRNEFMLHHNDPDLAARFRNREIG